MLIQARRLRLLITRRDRSLAAAMFLLISCYASALPMTFAPAPKEVSSTHFIVKINHQESPVLHAASHYYLLNFYVDGPVSVSVTADDPHFWDRGVEIQPMRFGIRPVRHLDTITFPIPGPIKLSISRPGDHFAESEMLFLFANTSEVKPVLAASSTLRYFAPGVHHENIDAESGDRIYLAPGAVVLGALNIWQVNDVRVFGTGTIIYDGPQNPSDDEGWMHKRNWHCIVMDQATNIEVDGITCITRSRTWQVQMKDSRHIGFYNVKIIGGNPNNANQDGMDWLGGGDTTVSNSFFRASDDVFALQGNWEGYDMELLRRPGHDVTNISIQNSLASTSISNIVRVGWPQKTFNSAHFSMRDVDVMHTGFGACKVPFSVFELWSDPDGSGFHEDYRFEKIRLEDWYSLFQVRQAAARVRGLSFDEVWAMDGPAMMPPVLKGDVRGTTLNNTALAGWQESRPDVLEGAEPPQTGQEASESFSYSSGILLPHQPVTFTAKSLGSMKKTFEWSFGDGTHSSGYSVRHRFANADGTLLDGSGRFRVLLHTRDSENKESWSSQQIVLRRMAPKAAKRRGSLGTSPSQPFEVLLNGSFRVPVAGGYTLTVITSSDGIVSIDHLEGIRSPRTRHQVCGSPGDALQPIRQSIILREGSHHIVVAEAGGVKGTARLESAPVVLLEGPGMSRQLLTIVADRLP